MISQTPGPPVLDLHTTTAPTCSAIPTSRHSRLFPAAFPLSPCRILFSAFTFFRASLLHSLGGFRSLEFLSLPVFICRLSPFSCCSSFVFFSLLANGLSHHVFSCPLVSRATRAVTSYVFLFVFISRLFPCIFSCPKCIYPPCCVLALCLSSFSRNFFLIAMFLAFLFS